VALAGSGEGFDDDAAFPRARVAMVPEGRGEAEALVKHREEIMRACAVMMSGDVELAAGTQGGEADGKWRLWRKRIKGVINGIDMDSGLDAWKRTKWATEVRCDTLKGKDVRWGGDQRFSLEEYSAAQRRGTGWMAGESRRMVSFLEAMRRRGTRRRPVRSKLRAKSYILQEAEAAVRGAKIEWCRKEGAEVLGLQHDGIWVRSNVGSGGEEAAEAMSRFASRRCGYEVVVKRERREEIRTEVEWDLPPLRAIREEGGGGEIV
jgi:hypothetical protein